MDFIFKQKINAVMQRLFLGILFVFTINKGT